MGGPKPTVKSFEIDKRLVYEAWVKVRANQGSAGRGHCSHRRVRSPGKG